MNIILTGDFNLHSTRDCRQYKIVYNILYTYNIENIINEPTRDKYILDHIHTNKLFQYLVIDNYISDHRSVLLNLNENGDPENDNKKI